MRKIDQIQIDVLAYFQEHAGKSMTLKEVSEALGYTDSEEFKALVKVFAQLEERGILLLNKTGQFRLKVQGATLTGTFRSNDRGFGFVTVDPNESDLFVPRGKTGSAMDGDTVELKITREAEPWNDKGVEAEVTAVLTRKSNQVVGEFVPYDSDRREETGFLGFVVPRDTKINSIVVYIKPEGIHPVEGSVCLVEITSYPTPQNPVKMEGLVTKEIGHKDAPGVDILAILYKFGIPSEFPEDVLAQAESIPLEIPAEALEGRRDLRSEQIVTIDGADAKDLDDAISLKKLENGNYLLGVHIADVSYYVTENSPIDREAYERGTSVYLTDRVVPMLPQKLSNGICSLLPHEDRLTMSCEMELDADGEVVAYDIFPSIIESKQRMTYSDVNAILTDHDKKLREKYSDFVPMFEEMAILHEILLKKRQKRGAIDFESDEAKIIVDENGHPLDIYVTDRGVGERLIESFMLSANETIAHHFTKANLPFIYRIHDQPDPTKMMRFLEFVTTFGILVSGTHENVKPKQLQAVLAKVKDEPYEAVVSTTLLRSMQQAKYDAVPVGHYGLAAKDYTHFTSPIRRYPDLIVHRLIRTYGKGIVEPKVVEKWKGQLPDIAVQSSQMERRSVDAERETESLKKAEFMMDKVGQEFEGVISSVTKFGIFVQLPNTVEGLVHISKMTEDYFNYIESHLLLMGERTGVIYRIGQKVKIKVEKSDPVTREIDFSLVIDKEKAQSQSDLDLVKQIRSKIPKGKKRNPRQSERDSGQRKKTEKGKEPFYSRPGKKAKGKKERGKKK